MRDEMQDGHYKTKGVSTEDHSKELLGLKQNLCSRVSQKDSVKLKNGFSLSLMGQTEHINDHFISTNYSELRCQSLPDCVEKSNESTLRRKECDKNINDCAETLQNSLTSESWFKTWPERCDKQKSNETSPSNSPVITPTKLKNTQSKLNCDNSAQNTNNKLTLNEALKNISLAYSPVTKQLHLIENTKFSPIPNPEYSDLKNPLKEKNSETISNDIAPKKIGHRRTEAGSFSSTISTLSDPSSNGSLLSTDDRSLSSFEIPDSKTRKKSLTNFFSK